MKVLMMLLCKGTCASVDTPFKRQGGSAHVMHSRSGDPAGASHELNQFLSTANLELLNAFICNSAFIYTNLHS